MVTSSLSQCNVNTQARQLKESSIVTLSDRHFLVVLAISSPMGVGEYLHNIYIYTFFFWDVHHGTRSHICMLLSYLSCEAPYVRSKGRKFEKARGRRRSRGFKAMRRANLTGFHSFFFPRKNMSSIPNLYLGMPISLHSRALLRLIFHSLLVPLYIPVFFSRIIIYSSLFATALCQSSAQR